MTWGIFSNIAESVLIRLEPFIWTSYLALCFGPTCAAQKCDRGRDGVCIRLSAYAHIEKGRHTAHAVYELYIDDRADPRVPPPSSAYTQMGHDKCVLRACAACMC